LSQIYKPLTSGGPIPPNIPTQFDTQDGNAVPSANILIVNAYDTTQNNNNGIETKGGISAGDPPGTGTSNELDIYLTNRLQASGSTVGSVTTPIATMNLGAVAGNYAWEFYVSGYEPTAPSGTAYNILSCIRTTGAAATLVSTSDESFVEDPALATSDVQVTVSGNSVVVNAIGIAGLTINWNVIGIYTFIG
jgi:hypothetical protein